MEMEKSRSVLDLLKDREVVIQAKGGTIYQGRFAGEAGAHYILSNAKIIGSNQVAYTQLVLISKASVQHIHPEPERLEEIQATQSKGSRPKKQQAQVRNSGE